MAEKNSTVLTYVNWLAAHLFLASAPEDLSLFLQKHINICAITLNIGDFLPGYGNVKNARDYERKIRNLIEYYNPDAWMMALKLLDKAKHDRHISIKQVRRLEGLFPPETIEAMNKAENHCQKSTNP